jgi:adenosylmethionine-8-amino-7-oxononanoate aminotransferase
MTSEQQAAERAARRAAIVAADKRYLWHPYTPMTRWLEEVDPLVVDRAQGARLFDVDGRSYLDANSSWYVASLGHGHPRLVEALASQARRLAHTSLAGVTHEPAARLAEELVAVAPPGLTRVFYSDDGSTAVEVALKLALQMQRQEGRPERTRFIALENAYHGDTIGAASLGGIEVFRRPFASVMLECVHVDSPADDASYAKAFEALDAVVTSGRDTIAAVVLEPILQGVNGMRTYDPEYLRRARALCDAHDVLLVADEVLTGYGRTGPMWAVDHAGVRPDILCMAKGFTGGMLPMAATLVTDRVFDAFLGPPEKAFYYGHSYCGNPLGAALAREVLAIYREEAILERAKGKAARIAAAFRRFASMPGVRSTRSLGMMGALDLDTRGGYLARGGWRVYDEALRRGAYLRPLGDVVYITPPINIADPELDELLGIVEESVRAAMTA